MPEAPAPALAGRCAVVTGSTGGLGAAVAAALAGAGCRLVLHGLEPEAALAGQLRTLAAAGTEATYVRANLSRREGALALAQAAQDFAAVDILVNNAVTRHFAPVDDFPPERWDEALAVNVSAPFHLIRAVVPAMRARGWGRIVNMVSVYGLRGPVGRVDYATSKAALIGMTRAVAMETVEAGVTCNAVCPGSVSTPGTEGRVEALMREEGLGREAAVRRFLAGKQPSGRFVEAGSVAAAVLFLCGDTGRDITGAVLPVEGGWLAS